MRALLGPGQDDVARRADARQDVQSGDAGGAGPDVIGVETITHGQRGGATGAGESVAQIPGTACLRPAARDRGIGDGRHETAIAQSEATLGGQGGVEIGGDVKRPIGDGAGLRHHRPVDGRIPALNDSGGPVVGRGDNREASAARAERRPSPTTSTGEPREPLAQQCGGVHGGREDLVRRGPEYRCGTACRQRPGGAREALLVTNDNVMP